MANVRITKGNHSNFASDESGWVSRGTMFCGTMFRKELRTVVRVTEGLDAPWARGGKVASQIPRGEARNQIGATHVLVQEACIKTVSCSHGVHGLYFQGGACEAIASMLCHCAIRPQLHHHHWDQRRKFFTADSRSLTPAAF